MRQRLPLRRVWLLFLLSVCLLAGCWKPSTNQAPPVAVDTTPAPIDPGPTPKANDTRTRWVYDNGWFAKGASDSWYEHNDEAQRIRGKAWEFRQTNVSKEYVTLYDASRGVTVRLSDTTAEARWDKDGKDAPWHTLLTGKWESEK